MTADRYTKAMLTVIAACLVWLSFGGPSMLPAASAQGVLGDRVVLNGWVDEDGAFRKFPNPYAPAFRSEHRQTPLGLPVNNP